MKFSVKEIKEKFIKKQVETNWDHVQKRIQSNKPLDDTFYDFSQEEGFALASIDAGQSFYFTVYLHELNNSEGNSGQIVFTTEDFVAAKEKKDKEQELLTLKPVSAKKKQTIE